MGSASRDSGERVGLAGVSWHSHSGATTNQDNPEEATIWLGKAKDVGGKRAWVWGGGERLWGSPRRHLHKDDGGRSERR